MVNPFTLKSRINRLEQEVLEPLYGSVRHEQHEWLLAETGRVIARHKGFMEELCCSSLISAIFKIIKLLGGAEKLSAADFERFTGYVNAGGLSSMITMLLSVEKEKIFLQELRRLPPHVQENAPSMLEKSRLLHADFIKNYFRKIYGSIESTPGRLQENFGASDDFIRRLTNLAEKNRKG